MLSLKKDVRGAFVDCLLRYINAMMILNFSQITLPLLALYVVLTYFVFVSGYKSIYGSRREDLQSTIRGVSQSSCGSDYCLHQPSASAVPVILAQRVFKTTIQSIDLIR
jgi:hypothetical protein